jgi:hypothetical protein
MKKFLFLIEEYSLAVPFSLLGFVLVFGFAFPDCLFKTVFGLAVSFFCVIYVSLFLYSATNLLCVLCFHLVAFLGAYFLCW